MTLMWLNNVNILVTRTISYWWNISSLHSLPEWSFDLGYTHNTHGISTFSPVTNPCENLPGWIIKRSQQDENAAQKHDNAGSETWPVDNGVVEGVTSSKNGGGSKVQTHRQRTAVEWSCPPKVGNVVLIKRTRLPRGAIIKKKVHAKEPHRDILCHQRMRNTFQELVYG